MAVTTGKSPVIMTAIGDLIGGPNAGAVDGRQWFITTVRFVTTSDSGVVKILDKAGGKVLFESRSLNPNDADEITQVNQWIDGAYVQDIPPNGASVYLYYC